MLVLTRKIDESIMIGDDVKITVVGVRGDQVKLGIEAPRHIPVHREEIYREIQEENRRAALAANGAGPTGEELGRLAGGTAGNTAGLGSAPGAGLGRRDPAPGAEAAAAPGSTRKPMDGGSGMQTPGVHSPALPARFDGASVPPGAPAPPG